MSLIINPSSLFRAMLNELGFPWEECVIHGQRFNAELSICNSMDLDDGATYKLAWEPVGRLRGYRSVDLSLNEASTGDLVEYIGRGGNKVDPGDVFLVQGFIKPATAVLMKIPNHRMDDVNYLVRLKDSLASNLDVPKYYYNFFRVIRRMAVARPVVRD